MNGELLKIKQARYFHSNMKNRMGCSEDWYNPYFAVANTFDDDALDKMSESEIKHLIKLATTIGSALY